MKGTVQQCVGSLELGQRAHQACVCFLNAPLVIGNSDLAAVVLGGPDGHHEGPRSSQQSGSHFLVIDVLNTATDFRGARRFDQMPEGLFQNRTADTIQKRLLEIGHADGLMILLITGDIRAHDAKRRLRIFHLPVLPQNSILAPPYPVLVVGHVERLPDLLVGDLDEPVGIGIVVTHFP